MARRLSPADAAWEPGDDGGSPNVLASSSSPRVVKVTPAASSPLTVGASSVNLARRAAFSRLTALRRYAVLPAVRTKKRSGFVLRATGAKVWWDVLVVLLVVYSAFSVPVLLCFDLSDSSGTLFAWDIFVDVVFALDVLLTFFTTYDQLGVTIFSRRRIAMHYLRGWFALDLIACLPWEVMADGSAATGGVVTVLRGCRALRLLRLSRLFKFLRGRAILSHALRMLRLIFFFLLFAHWVACLWFALGAWNSRSSDGLDGWLAALTPPLDPDTADFGELYITSLYWVCATWITVGYGDVTPRTDLEKVYTMLTMVVGAIIYASIFGNVAVLLHSLGRLDNVRKEKMEAVNGYMTDLQLPATMQKRVVDYYTFLWARHKSFSGVSNQLSDLPPSLTNQIASFLHQDTIEKCPVFRDADTGFLRAVTTKLKFCVSLPGDFLFREGDAADKVFFLRKGRVEITADEFGVLTVLEEGAYFGEACMLVPSTGVVNATATEDDASSSSSAPGPGASSGSRKRSASAQSVVSSDLYYLMRSEFLAILSAFPSYSALFLAIAVQRLKQTGLHSDELLVEKLFEQHAKRGWLKIRGIHQHQHAPSRSHIHTASSIVAAMARRPTAGPRSGSVLGGPTTPTADGPPLRIGMKGLLLKAAAQERQRQDAATAASSPSSSSSASASPPPQPTYAALPPADPNRIVRHR